MAVYQAKATAFDGSSAARPAAGGLVVWTKLDFPRRLDFPLERPTARGLISCLDNI